MKTSALPFTASAPRAVFQMFQASMTKPMRYIRPPSARTCMSTFVEVTASRKFGYASTVPLSFVAPSMRPCVMPETYIESM